MPGRWHWVLEQLTGGPPRPVLRTAINGCLGYMDTALLDCTEHGNLPRVQLRELLAAGFGAALMAARQADPEIWLGAG